ncbi:MAG: carboxypeptidase-like regulatory domain-containing protein, partial [Bryobacterales bacterium]|nr:carboxypeptidase-like regulatory domain-containing protein [Bryobacteraceae bacterium]MDW8131762.1 carboxypeptidase-like regulatory domain-containing protein [Bryobacterales bacterium]
MTPISLGLVLLLAAELRILVRGPDGQPLERARVEVSGRAFHFLGQATREGMVVIQAPAPGTYRVRAWADGYWEAAREVEAPAELEFVLVPAAERLERIEVRAVVDPAMQPPATSVASTPARPATVREALPLIPGVARTVEGKLVISDAAEHRSTMLVNSLDATDPATGKFGATVPLDAVAAFQVEKNPFLAEYGRFTTGVVTVETRRAGERWSWVLNDPTPELRIRSGRLRGIRGFTPRLSVGGPLGRGAAGLWQSVEYVFKETPVLTQPFPRNETRRQAWNWLTQLDANLGGRHLLSGTVHVAPERLDYMRLDFYNPQEATPSFRGREWMLAAAHSVTLAGGWMEAAISRSGVRGLTRPQGSAGLRMYPNRHEGHYPFRHARSAERWQARARYTAAPWRGHHFKAGGWLLRSASEGLWQATQVTILDMQQRLLRRILWHDRPGFAVRDGEASWFVHDSWAVTRSLNVAAGLRMDGQTAARQLRWAPRLSVGWSPGGDGSRMLRAGYGWFYDRVPLNVFGFESYPESLQEELRRNVLDRRKLSPHARVWSVQWDQRLFSWLQYRARFIENRASRLIVVRPQPGALRLAAEGRSRSRHGELVCLLRFGQERELYASYVLARARSHLNEFSEFLGDTSAVLVRPDAYAVPP